MPACKGAAWCKVVDHRSYGRISTCGNNVVLSTVILRLYLMCHVLYSKAHQDFCTPRINVVVRTAFELSVQAVMYMFLHIMDLAFKKWIC